jgi:hypothetical protein
MRASAKLHRALERERKRSSGSEGPFYSLML